MYKEHISQKFPKTFFKLCVSFNTSSYLLRYKLKTFILGAGVMAQGLRTFVLPKDPSLIPSTQQSSSQSSVTPVPEHPMPTLTFLGSCMHTVHVYTTRYTQIHKDLKCLSWFPTLKYFILLFIIQSIIFSDASFSIGRYNVYAQGFAHVE